MAGAAHRDERAAHRRSALGRVRGLGSAKEGVQHWWMQRLTAIALVPLLVWFVASILAHIGAGFWHMALGLQVVIEDYVRSEALKLGLIVFVQFAALALALAAATALLVIAFGG